MAPPVTAPAPPSAATSTASSPHPHVAPPRPVRAHGGRARSCSARPRRKLQTEVINAFDSILDSKAEEIRAKIEGIVDRVVKENGFAVTRDERERLVEEMVDEVTGLRARWSHS